MSDAIPITHHAHTWEFAVDADQVDYAQMMQMQMARKISGQMFQSPVAAPGATAPAHGHSLPMWTAASDMQHAMHMHQHSAATVQHEAPPLFVPQTQTGGAFGFDAPNPIGDQPMTPSGRASSSSRTNSRSSSPFSASAPLDSPLGAWEEPAAEEGTSSEGESAASLHSASRPAQAHATYVSGVSTPFDNMHMHASSQQQQQQPHAPNGHTMMQSSPPVPRPFNPLPEQAQFAHSQAAAHQQYQQQMSLMQTMLQQQMVMPPMPQVPHIFNGEELHAGPTAPSQPFGIGMLPTAPLCPLDPSNNGQEITSGPSSVVDTSPAGTPNIGGSERLQVRAKRRTRYSAAAASPSASTRSGVHPSFRHSSSIESSRTSTRGGGPTDNDGGQQQQQRASSAQQQSQSQESCGSASGQSSENEEQQQASEDEEEEQTYTAKATPSKSSAANKRKRTSTSKAAASTKSEDGEESTPNMKGLDKRERNKLSASQYRKRRKVYLDSLEGKVGELDHTIAKQGETISKMAAENRSLKEQLSFFKKLVGHINPTLLKDNSNNNNHNNNQNQYHQQQQQQQYQQQMPAAAAAQQQQPTNMHHTGARGARHMGGGAMGFMMIVIACILLCNPAAFLDFGGEVESGAPSSSASFGAPHMGAVGRRGRTLLSVPDEPIVFVQPDALHEFTGGYDAAVSAAPFATLSNETDAAAALLDGLTLADKVPLCGADSTDSCIHTA